MCLSSFLKVGVTEAFFSTPKKIKSSSVVPFIRFVRGSATQGGTSVKNVRGCSCQSFGHDPIIQMAQTFGPQNKGLKFQLFYSFPCLIQSSLLRNHKNCFMFQKILLEKIINTNLMLFETWKYENLDLLKYPDPNDLNSELLKISPPKIWNPGWF